MDELTPQQKKKLLLLAEVADGGNFTMLEKMFEMQDSFDKAIEDTKTVLEEAKSAVVETKQGIEEVVQMKQNTEIGAQGEQGNAGKDGKDGKNGKDGRDGRDGRDGTDGVDGKDADETLIIDKIELDLPKLGTSVRDGLELLRGDERLDSSAIKGLGQRFKKLSEDILNRAIEILDQRTSFLIQKVSNLSDKVNNLATGGGSSITVKDEGTNITTALASLNFVGSGVTATNVGNDVTVTVTATGGTGYQPPLSGGLTGTNTWSSAPNVLVIDGVPRQKIQTDGTVNWTGTTTTVLTGSPLPTYDIFASA